MYDSPFAAERACRTVRTSESDAWLPALYKNPASEGFVDALFRSMLLTKAEAQESLIKMQTSAAEFTRQAGNLSARYSSVCKELTESTKTALSTVTRETNQQLSNMAQAARKKIHLCVWISITAVILCAALCALAVLWSR